MAETKSCKVLITKVVCAPLAGRNSTVTMTTITNFSTTVGMYPRECNFKELIENSTSNFSGFKDAVEDEKCSAETKAALDNPDLFKSKPDSVLRATFKSMDDAVLPPPGPFPNAEPKIYESGTGTAGR